MVIEIPGKESDSKAEKLADKLKKIFNNRNDVRVNRPIKMAEIRIKDLDDFITPKEVISAVALNGGCREEEVTAEEIRQRTLRLLGMIWIRCPVAAARRIVQNGKITIEWSSAKVERLPARSMQCFRCLRTGHVKSQCRSAVDRSGRCFTCGERSHVARGCKAPPNCPICSDLGVTAAHRLGSRDCNPPREEERARRNERKCGNTRKHC